MRRILTAGAVLLFVWPAACAPIPESPERAAASVRLEDLTGAHTRLVWLQDAWDLNDVFSERGQVRLMGLDSRDGLGERVLLPGPAPLQKPLLTPCGQRIVFTDTVLGAVCVIDWSGENRRTLAGGVGVAVRAGVAGDPVWVYAARQTTRDPGGGGGAFTQLVRFDLDDPAREEAVWDRTPVGRDNLQISADGRFAAGMFPWPRCGVADLVAGTWEELGRGCWTVMTPDNRYLMGFLNDTHRALTLVDTQRGKRWPLPLAGAPGIDGQEVYHPRWSNHPRFMVMTGPYTIRRGGNNIRGGGGAVEIHVGRLREDFGAVETWAQATDNPYANFFPDLWIGSP